MSDFLYVGDHGDTLAGGLRVNPGDEVPASQVDTDRDAWLLDERLLIALEPQTLTGDALKQRAADLEIDGRASMTAAQLRTAVAKAESAQAQATTDDDEQEG